MNDSISIDELASELARTLGKYTEEVGTQVKVATDEVMSTLVKDTKRDAPKRTGRYRKYIAKKTLFEDKYEKRVVWYVKKPHYRLAHLLENPHNIVRNGVVIGRSAPYPHIRQNEEKANKAFEEKLEEILNNAGI